MTGNGGDTTGTEPAPPEPSTSRSLRNRLLSGGVWVLVGKAATAVASLVVNAMIARLLAVEEAGVYQLTYSIVMFSAIAAQLGLGRSVVRLVAEAMGKNRPGRARGAVRWVLIFAAGGGIAVFLLLADGPGRWLALVVFDTPALAGVLVLVGLWTALLALQNVISETFRGFFDMRGAAVFGGVISGILTALAYAALWVFRGEAKLDAIVAIAAGAILVSLSGAGLALRGKLATLGEPERVRPREVTSIAWPLLFSNLMSQGLLQADMWILGALGTEEQLAVYGFAARLVRVVAIPLMIVNMVVPPFVAEMYFAGDRERLVRVLRGTATLAGIPAAIVLVAFIAFGDPILGNVFRDEYRQGATVLAILSVGRLVNVWTGSCGVTLGLTGHQRTLMGITSVTSVITVAAVYFSVQPYGIEGVATAVSAGVILHNVSMWIATRRLTGLWTHAGIPSRADLRSILSQLRPKK